MNERGLQSTALIVGAGALGMAIARRLGDTHRVVLADRDPDRLDRQVANLECEGHDARGIVCDILDGDSVAALGQAARADGRCRVLAHVVGLSPSMADAETILAVNIAGAARVADAFVDVVGPGGVGVFVASLAGHGLEPDPAVVAALDRPTAADFIASVTSALASSLTPELAYSLSKWAVIRMCRRRAGTWAARDSRIVSVSPGLIQTPMGARETDAQPARRALLERLPLRREGTMIEVADAVAFLVSPRASYVTGTDLLVDGGIAAAMEAGPGMERWAPLTEDANPSELLNGALPPRS